MAGEIKPGDRVWVRGFQVSKPDEAPGRWLIYDGEAIQAIDDDFLIPDSPALPAVARLIHDGPGLAAAVRRSMAAVQAMADGLAGNGPGADVEYAAELIATQDVMGRLAAALEVGNGTNG